MKIECKINIDLQEIQKEYKNKFLNNEDIYHYISENIETEEVGNRGFLS